MNNIYVLLDNGSQDQPEVYVVPDTRSVREICRLIYLWVQKSPDGTFSWTDNGGTGRSMTRNNNAVIYSNQDTRHFLQVLVTWSGMAETDDEAERLADWWLMLDR